MFKIAKEFQFDACHMLDGHNGKCHNLHGHTYRLLVEISNELITNGSSADMVMDYADIKSVVKQQIIDQLDHAYLYNQNNTNERQIAELLQQMQRKIFAFPCRTTAEGMSKFIFDHLSQFLPVSMIKLWETPTSYCEYHRGEK
ncbi:6-carboxytetrahydropterin synthase QueD [Gilliamella sp. W8126]|uniref:6-carboxy-5,6,7,8-tetrahydropterin synthase n=1 Tax=Gilliamella apis TaxID=1970738 RepID=A0A2V4DY53_9GAMM|nr:MULTISPECIES: 6-carboxytetrahydropterin synthase QueD [Gilliamella]MBI0004866.1 6-carboxytetrahydropterin synthase QueD [Gilliamella sp. W8126]MBI0037982.1 6-carboxytetrahydropterin synthase QueD [Gilliamella sp. B14384G10]MBI0039977.1 6-carboxytetrahydropterin synthase QueD [Gilliamella sp. B14384G7]MBI0051817.1 6-carboxytetrahydropterin synthase QueD [Gilliamella sp. B14384G13]MBI0054269.1 6-carboxytetrahydropterin synthase QueD [Gilliamella sp. B14384H2]